MNYTNNFNINSKSLVDALSSDDYDLQDVPDNVISVTELIDSPTIFLLKRQHKDELTCDVSQNVWSLLGSSVHHILELSNSEESNRLSEARWFLLLPVLTYGEKSEDGWDVFVIIDDKPLEEQSWYKPDRYYVSGKLDNYERDQKVLEDYKITSSYSFTYGGKKEWGEQLNIHAFVLRLMGQPVELLRIVGIIKDHDQNRADRDEDYPQIPIVELEYPIIGDAEVMNLIRSKVVSILAKKPLADSALPKCDDEYRWYRNGKFAIMKKGSKRAVKGGVFEESREGRIAAEKMLFDLGDGYYIEERPGIDVRCADKRDFCPVKKFCDYYNRVYGNSAPKADDWE